MPGIRQNKRGFTLIEIISTIVLIGIFSYGVALYVVRVVDSWKFLTQRYNLEQNGKLALDFIVRDLRMIDINSSGNPDISSASGTAITFINTDSKVITYSYDNSAIEKNNQPLVKDVNSFVIKYYKQNNNEINPGGGSLSLGQINQIWYLYVKFVLKAGDQNIVYSSYIFPRNFLML